MRSPSALAQAAGWVLIGLVLAAAAALSLPGAAAAISQRGYVYAGALTVPPSDGGLQEPAGVAVAEASGQVYVVDRGENRIDRLTADGQFLEAWGWGVADGEARYERCTTLCRPGLAGHGKFQLEGAQAIAVDNSAEAGDPSAGDVYVEAVTSEEHGALDKFGPDGEQLGIRHAVGGESFEALHGLTVDAHGAVWVYDEEVVYVLSDGEPNRSCPEAGAKGLASCPGFGKLEPEFEGNPLDGLATDGNGHVYVGHEALTGVPGQNDAISRQALLGGSGEALLRSTIEELDHETTNGLAVDAAGRAGDPSAGDVFLDNSGSLAVFDETGALVQRVVAPGEPQAGAGVAVDAAAGAVYMADTGSGQIDHFVLEGEGPPTVGSPSAQDAGAESVQLDGLVDPHGAGTSYAFRLSPGTLPARGEPCSSPCRELPAPAGTLAASYGEDAVTAQVGGLAPATTYRFELLASNEDGGHEQTVESAQRDFTTLPASVQPTADARDWELVSPPLGGAAEPITAAGGVIEAALDGQALTYVASAPSGEAEGSRSFEATQMLAARGGGGWSQQDIVTPNEQGNGLEIGSHPEYEDFAPDLALALVSPFPDGSRLAEPPLSPPLTAGEEGHQEKTLYLRADAPLQPPASTEPFSEAGIYSQARAAGSIEHNPGYLALVTAADDTAGTPFGQEVEFLDAAPDLTHVVIESKVPLTPGSAPANNLYEFSEGRLTLINVLPGPARTPVAEAELGYQDHELRGAVSANGRRVFWSDEGHLYETDVLSGESIQLDGVQGGTGSGRAGAVFQGASADGSRVFFTDQQQLSPGSGAAAGKPDLYVCELKETRPGPPRCALSDLSESYEGESAAVQGLVLGTSEDGSAVYFVANGVLSAQTRGEGAQPGQCRKEPQPNAHCNLYMAHFNELLDEPRWEARLVARLSNEDGPDWHPPGLADDLGQLTSRVSPNGRFLAFMSEEAQALAGYDNRDANPEAQGARDEEVFLYDASDGKLRCASCDPSGARPRGVLDPSGAGENPEGIGLLVDRTQAWRGHWLAGSVPGWTRVDHDHALYQSRYLSDAGRLFFESPADLLAAATNHKEDVYEYEPQGVPSGAHRCSSASAAFVAPAGGCLGLISSGTSTHESAFLDAGEAGGEGPAGQTLQEGGGDVFFITAAQLVPQAAQAGYAVYDAHECTSALPCLAPSPAAAEPCVTLESCRPAGSVEAPSIVVQTQTTAGAGNQTPSKQGVKGTRTTHPTTRAQKLRRELQACRRRYRRGRRRSSCEAKARRRYGARAAARKSHRSGR